MKKLLVVAVAVVLVVSLSVVAFAADMKKGVVKSVDAKAGTIVFTVDGGSDMTLKADKGVDLSKVSAGMKAEISVEKNVVKEIKEMKKKRPLAVGC